MRPTHLLPWLLLPLFAACTDDSTAENNEPTPQASFALERGQSCEALQERWVNATTERLLERYDQTNWDSGVVEDSPSQVTQTNVQEEGVDEPDRLKTDGQYTYTLSGSMLRISKTWPVEEAALVAQVSFEEDHGLPTGLLLLGPKLAVLSRHGDGDAEAYVRLTVLDVSDPTTPRTLSTQDYQGRLVDARRHGALVSVAVRQYFEIPDGIWSLAYADDLPAEAGYDATDAEIEALKDEVRPILRERVAAALPPLEEALPWTRVNDQPKAAALTCGDVYVNSQTDVEALLSVLRLDLENPTTPLTVAGLLAGGYELYASANNLYVTGTGQGQTIIHRFGLTGAQAAYLGTGEVPGYLLNAYAMSEHEGHLRVATTAFEGNRVSVLALSEGALTEVGAVGNLANGERIYAARFLGDKGYLVTFRQTDPLFTLDLSDPTAPRVVGELHINGFSTYLHPLGEDHLLAIGQDGTDDGDIIGLHLQVFDVSDPANPTRSAHLTLEQNAESAAEQDPHALTFDAARGLLAIPVVRSDSDEAALALFQVSAQEIVARGEVSHRPLNPSGTYAPYIQRSVLMDDFVLTMSEIGLALSALSAPETLLKIVRF